MPKRKREDDAEDKIMQIPDQALRIKVARLKARFDHGVKQLTAQLKLARAFDRQKMARRTKEAGGDAAKIARLEAEIEVLKKLSEPKVAKHYLLKQCVRTKRIRESQAFSALFGKDVEAKTKSKPSVAESNVLGRLFKSKAVSDVLPDIMKGIRDVVGADKPVQSNTTESEVKHEAADDTFSGFSDTEPAIAVRDINGHEQKSNSEEPEPEDDILQNYDSRLAPSSDEEDEDSLGQNHGRRLDDMEITTDEEIQDEDDVLLDSDDIDSLSGSDPRSTSAPVLRNTLPLPALMNGGYYSGSESEDDNLDGYDPDKAYAATAQKERKNRRGQQARRAIAEKKFGQRAKHLIKAKGAEGVHGDRQRMISAGQSRNQGWDPKRGAVDSARGTRNGLERRLETFEQRNGAHESIKSKPVKKEAGTQKLHPSWEAARKRKMETNPGAASFAGKKITFD